MHLHGGGMSVGELVKRVVEVKEQSAGEENGITANEFKIFKTRARRGVT